MTGQRARSLAWTGFGLAVASIPLTGWLLAHPLVAPLPLEAVLATIVAFIGALAFSFFGALILSRYPRHSIGWLFALSGLATAVGVDLSAYVELSSAAGWTWLPSVDLAHASAVGLLQSGVFLPLTLGLLLFPDGRLPSRRWWPAAASAVIGLLMRLPSSPSEHNPPLIENIGDAGVLLTVAAALAGLASLYVRWRRAGPDLRQQLKWMAAAAVLVVIAFIADIIISIVLPDLISGDAEFLLFAATYTCIPAAAGTAILRYGLYDIDLIINRALVYIGLTAFLAGLYAGSTATFQRVFIAITGASSDAAIVITVAMIATLFTPARNGLQRMVDVRFKDARDLQRTMESLEREVGAVVDVMVGERLAERLLKAARQGADAVGAALYLDGHPDDGPAYTDGHWNGKAELVVQLRAGDRQLGRMLLTERRHGIPYAQRERDQIQKAADVVAVGLALASQKTPVPIPS